MDIVTLALAKKGILNSLAEAKEYTDAKTAGGLKYQGSKPTVADLPTPSESIKGHMYTIVENGHEYVCDGTLWVDLSADLVNKLNVLPKVDDPTDPGVGWPYHIPYRFDVKLDSEKANIDLYTITLDNTLTKMGFNKLLLGASTTTAGLMTAADKIRLDDNHSIELTGTSGEIQKSDAERLVNDKLFYFILESKKFYFNKSTTLWSPRHGSVVKTNVYVNVELNKLNLITVIVPIDSEEKASGIALWDLSDINLQTTISDLETIRSGASAGATAYQKPSAGIPSTDMAESVQTSLDKADTALQEHQSLADYRTSAAQDIIDATKQDVLTAGTNVQINNNVISATDTTYTAGTNINIKNNVISVTGVKTFQPFPSAFNNHGTLAEFLLSIYEYNPGAGVAYLGGVYDSCVPRGLLNGECKVEYMTNNGAALVTVSSSDTFPFMWVCNSAEFNRNPLWKGVLLAKLSNIPTGEDFEKNTYTVKLVKGEIQFVEG